MLDSAADRRDGPALPAREQDDGFRQLPDPRQSSSLDMIAAQLRGLKIWAGDLSYGLIKDRVNAAWTEAGRPAIEMVGKSTVADCFRPGRRRLNSDLVLAVVEVLQPDPEYVELWRHALRAIDSNASRALQVRVHDALPQDLPGFTGRADELDRIRHCAQQGQSIITIEGMAGVGKTRLAVHAGRVLAQERHFDRVFFVDLRGFHPDPTEPPVDPGAVLNALMSLLSASIQQLPRDLNARTAAFRNLLAGLRVLLVLDNAADEKQIRPLIVTGPGCLTLVTSRRRFAGGRSMTHLDVEVFTAPEAEQFLRHAAPDVAVGPDSRAPARIARRCGYLPLALGLIAGLIRRHPDWTLTDHADRLDNRHEEGRLDSAVEIALDMSYRHLPALEQQLLRLLALHPGHDFDVYAAAALTRTPLTATLSALRHLCADNVLQRRSPNRYTFHDLVRAWATARAGDDESPSAQRAASTRLFDYYLSAAADAAGTLFPAEADSRPTIESSTTPAPVLSDPFTALAWLDTERTTLVAVAVHTADRGWPTHTIRLAAVLVRYLMGGHHTDALTVHGHALHAAQSTGEPTGQARALANLGAAYLRLGRPEQAVDHLRQALHLNQRIGNQAGQANALNNLGIIEVSLGRYEQAADHYQQALHLFQETGSVSSAGRTLTNLGNLSSRLGNDQQAAEYLQRGLALSVQSGDRTAQANQLGALGRIETKLGRDVPAQDHTRQALVLFQQFGDRTGEANALDSLGTLYTGLGRCDQATEYHQQALDIFRKSGERDSEAVALNGLGEASQGAGQPDTALAQHGAALTIAAETGNLYQQARAHAGLGHAHHARHDLDSAGSEYQQAVTLYTGLGLAEADQIREHLTAVSASRSHSAIHE